MPTGNVAAALEAFEIISGFVARVMEARDIARAAAADMGVSDAQLDAAEARFSRVYPDPLYPQGRELAGLPPVTTEIPTPSIYNRNTLGPTPSDADLLLLGFRIGDSVCENVQGWWEVTEPGQLPNPSYKPVRLIQ